MAKKKAVTPDRKPKQSGEAQSSKAVPVLRGQQRLLTSAEIGQVAGEVWQLLSDEQNGTLASIKKSIDAPEMLIMAAIGWLAREDKLEISTSGRNTNVSLR